MNTTKFQIAVMRAKACARSSVARAVRHLMAVGVELADAARFVMAVLRGKRKAVTA